MTQKTYIAIDLKSFFASVECRERGLDPLDTHLVVADESRTDKTICLAVTSALKSFGIPGRARLFEVKQKVQQVNAARKDQLRGRAFSGSTHFFSEWQKNPSLSLDFLIAPPRMATYMAYSTRIYGIYMKYVAPEDVIVYSIDEVFIDATSYLKTYELSPHEDDSGRTEPDWKHGNGGNRDESLSLQGGDGCAGQAYPCRSERGSDRRAG